MNEKSDRADKVLVALGHFESRASAQAAIAVGHVKIDGKAIQKPSEKIRTDAAIEARPAHPWVSRGGVKLAHALDVFDVPVADRACLDIGASTGGFTHVLLSRGAATVVAVDVGRGQLNERLQRDQRVRSLEATDARDLTIEQVGDANLNVCDASFISLCKLLARPLSLVPTGAGLITLFKPQFEVGRAHIGKNGIVSDQAAVESAQAAFMTWLADNGWTAHSVTKSPIKGGDGNVELLMYAVKSGA